MKIQNYINHITFVIDRSGSMSDLSDEVVEVFDSQVKYLAQRSKELDQETRVTLYLFSDTTQCIIYDKDVLRLPSLAKLYNAGGSTSLIDATLKSIEDLKKIPELYCDHAFLIYVLSDGAENTSYNSASKLASEISKLPDNWTLAVLVPDQLCSHEAKKFGFPANNIQIWSTNNAGLKEVGETVKAATNSFMQARATGLRSTKNLFSLNTNNLKSDIVTKKLDALDPKDYEILNVRKDSVIKDFVESWKLPYVVGSSYYQLSKTEKIQATKNVIVQNKLSGKLYTGDKARELLGLPNTEVKVSPSNFNNYNIYIQSTSVNRKLVAGTQLVYIK